MEHGADLWAGFHTSSPGAGDSRPADITEVAVAKRIC